MDVLTEVSAGAHDQEAPGRSSLAGRRPPGRRSHRAGGLRVAVGNGGECPARGLARVLIMPLRQEDALVRRQRCRLSWASSPEVAVGAVAAATVLSMVSAQELRSTG